MKKYLTILFAALMVFVLSGLADAAQKRFTAQVYKFDGTKQVAGSPGTLITTGITYKVLQRNTDTSETLLAPIGPTGSAVTSKTNPVTTTVFAVDGKIDFVCDPAETLDTYVDLIVVDTNGGFTAVVEDFTNNNHTIIINETPGIVHQGCIWFGVSSNVATDTGVNFLADTMVMDVRVEVVTVDSGMTLSVGTEDTASGFRSGVSMTTAGYIADTGVITGGSTIDYTAASTYGTLLYTAITGSDAVATCGGRSYLGHVVTTVGTNDDLYYTGSTGSDTAVGYLHFTIIRLR